MSSVRTFAENHAPQPPSDSGQEESDTGSAIHRTKDVLKASPASPMTRLPLQHSLHLKAAEVDQDLPPRSYRIQGFSSGISSSIVRSANKASLANIINQDTNVGSVNSRGLEMASGMRMSPVDLEVPSSARITSPAEYQQLSSILPAFEHSSSTPYQHPDLMLLPEDQQPKIGYVCCVFG